MKVGRYDYAGQIDDWPALVARIERVLRAGSYVLGPEVAAFERALTDYLGAPRALGTNSGTDALVLAHRAADLGRGRRVVTAANTFHATVAATVLAGAEPVLVDADPATFTLDPQALAALDGRTLAAVMPVHLYGQPAAMAEIDAFAQRHGLTMIEDAAQAIGARHRGRRVGALGDYGCFSFHPSKNLAAAGDGGAIVLAGDPATVATRAARLDALRSLGQTAQNDHREVGLNSKLDTIQAIVLHDKLARLDAWNADRRRIAALYRERLAGLPLTFQHAPEDVEPVYHLFQVRTDARDALRAALAAAGVDAVVRYPVPIHLQPAFAGFGWRAGQFPVAEALARELLALPIRPGMSDAEIDHVVAATRWFFGASAG
ncbi:MAG: DegT/DnrJ/EryC1/StrS family aminotransferase [Planctomycetes bacterium]|nr:DegT/DnrJ/EryC1/StrS family aminotransferase [Planctomycetota bacterium]